MTFTYSDPSTIPRDALRLLCGDTDANQVLLADEEYDFVAAHWSSQPDIYLQAAYCCETIAGKLARQIDISADSQTLNAGDLQQKFLTLAERLRSQAGSDYPGTIYVGGIDIWAPLDPTVIPPAFGTQMHDNPAAGTQDLGDINDGLQFADGPEFLFPWP
jgi:hypothetical protein